MLGLHYSRTGINVEEKKEWKIRIFEANFDTWGKNLASYLMFFDGAAKGNRGCAGAGGVIRNIEGHIEHIFAWGLGQDTNSQAEGLALLQGLKILHQLNIKEAKIIGDSQTIIKMLVENTSPKDIRLLRLMMRIKQITNSFHKVSFFHVMRNNNKDVDMEANRAARLPAGTLVWNEKESWDLIP